MTERGRPYFVMEHIQGVPITDYCDRHKLTNRERLTLFTKVCEGVQQAHHKAVIHRDIKPGIVLVTIQNDQPMPKIIDFGVAKATSQKLTDQTMHTQLGALIGTPAYMSPEQAEMTGQDIDTRTDVYALGVLLYELLVGDLPFDMDELKRAGIEGIAQKIREIEPLRPSVRVTSQGEKSTQSAARRQTEIPALKRELSGDLDSYKRLERHDEVEAVYREAAETGKRALGADHPTTLAALDTLNWYQLTREPVESRNPAAALESALFVVEAGDGSEPDSFETLALAYHVTGESTKAIEFQKRAIALVPADQPDQRADLEAGLAEFEQSLH
jgi:serine/threonine protein kinase